MGNFQLLLPFKVNDITDNHLKHIFYKVVENDIYAAEKKLGFALPKELVSFYRDVGYGFMNRNSGSFNRLLDPLSVAQIFLKEDFYEGDPDLEVYDHFYNNDKLLFFEINEGSYLAIDKLDEGGKNKIYYFDKKVFDSLEEFVTAFIKNPDLIIEIDY